MSSSARRVFPLASSEMTEAILFSKALTHSSWKYESSSSLLSMVPEVVFSRMTRDPTSITSIAAIRITEKRYIAPLLSSHNSKPKALALLI